MQKLQYMKKLTILFCTIAALLITVTVNAQTGGKGVTVNNNGAGVKSSTGSGASVKKGEAKVTSANGGGSTINKSGASATNKNGAGVSAQKGQVQAKSSNGNGATVNNKGVNVKGSKGGMVIDKKKLEIKSKNVNIKLGK